MVGRGVVLNVERTNFDLVYALGKLTPNHTSNNCPITREYGQEGFYRLILQMAALQSGFSSWRNKIQSVDWR